MAISNHSYIVVGDKSDFGDFSVEYNGLNVYIRNIHDERFCLMLDKEDWEELKKFIDEQFQAK